MKDDSIPKIFEDDDLDEAVIAADDTGMIAAERLITVAEIEEAEEKSGHAGDV